MGMCRMVAFIVLILSSPCLVTSELKVIPKIVVVLLGDSIVLNCPGTSLNWIYTDLYNKHEHRDIYFNERQLLFRKNDFSILGNKGFEANLLIKNVSADMAGLYSCKKEEVDLKEYEVTVLENNPLCSVTSMSGERSVLNPVRIRTNECSGLSSYRSSQNDFLKKTTNGLSQHEFIGPNTCGIAPDKISLSCSVTYYGNESPVLELKYLRENKVIACSETILPTNNRAGSRRLTCNATVQATIPLDEEQFIWKTEQSAQTQYNYTTEKLKILYCIDDSPSNYTTVQPGYWLNCTANCSHPYGYMWTRSETPDQGGHQYVNCTKELIAKEAGFYTCKAICHMGEQHCEVTAMRIEVPSPSSSEREVGGPATTDSKTIVPIVVAIAIFIVAVVLATAYLIHGKIGRRNRPQNHNGNQNAEDANQNQTQFSLLQETQESNS